MKIAARINDIKSKGVGNLSVVLEFECCTENCCIERLAGKKVEYILIGLSICEVFIGRYQSLLNKKLEDIYREPIERDFKIDVTTFKLIEKKERKTMTEMLM